MNENQSPTKFVIIAIDLDFPPNTLILNDKIYPSLEEAIKATEQAKKEDIKLNWRYQYKIVQIYN